MRKRLSCHFRNGDMMSKVVQDIVTRYPADPPPGNYRYDVFGTPAPREMRENIYLAVDQIYSFLESDRLAFEGPGGGDLSVYMKSELTHYTIREEPNDTEEQSIGTIVPY